jgi:predicted nucleotidyltransferase component of viral defense system
MGIVAEAEKACPVENLRLDGGTALAAYFLHHRESEDLDFFADPGLKPAEFGEEVRRQAERAGVRIEQYGGIGPTMGTYTATDPGNPATTVKLQFVVQSPYRLAPLETTEEGILVSSYRDVCAGKLHAVCDRIAYRDFYDVHVILTRGERDVPEEVIAARFAPLLADLREIDPGLYPTFVGQALSRLVDRSIIEMIPLKLLIPATNQEIHRTLMVCVAECARQAILE